MPLWLAGFQRGTVIEARAGYPVGSTSRSVRAWGVITRSPLPARVEASLDAGVVAEQARVATAGQIEHALKDYSAGRLLQARHRLQLHLRWLGRQRRLSSSAVFSKKATEVRRLLSTMGRHAPASNEGIIALRLNKARNQEVRRGLDAAQIYHGNQGEMLASELE